MERRAFTLAEMNTAIRTASKQRGEQLPFDLARPGLRHVLYVAKRRAKETSGNTWQVQESLQPQIPTTYDTNHTTAVFNQLIGMIGEQHNDTVFLGLTEEVIREAEAILLTASSDTDSKQTLPTQRKEFVDQRTPYPVRGHHIGFIWRLTQFHKPSDIANDIRNYYAEIKRNSNMYTDAAVRGAIDHIGNTPQDGETYIQSIIKELQEFKELPDNYPVELVTGEPDKMCSGCIFGNHCKVKTSELRQMSMIDHDREVLGVFVNEARHMRINHALNVFQRRVTFSDAEPQIVEGIRTTAGILRIVAENAPVDWEELTNVFPPELRTLKDPQHAVI